MRKCFAVVGLLLATPAGADSFTCIERSGCTVKIAQGASVPMLPIDADGRIIIPDPFSGYDTGIPVGTDIYVPPRGCLPGWTEVTVATLASGPSHKCAAVGDLREPE